VTLDLHPEFLALSRNHLYLLAISGGRDSVALLHTLLDAGYKKLTLCHLNHGLRGKASDLDAGFVRQLAKSHNLPCEIGQADVSLAAKHKGESVELAARHARHAFFGRCAHIHQCRRVLLAHHADDQAETILFNLLRGSGGLKGIQFSTTHQIDGKELTFIRPLLETPRSEINNYLNTHQTLYREDASNAEPIATRNRIRNEVIPLLTEIMGRKIQPALIRAAKISQTNNQALHETLNSLQLEDPQGRLFLPKLATLPPALQQMALHRYLKQNSIGDINADLLKRCASLIHSETPSKINLPGAKFLRRKEKRLFIS